MTGSYESAAQVATKWGSAVDDSKLHALVQRVGAKAEEQTEQRVKSVPQERRPERKPSELGVLLVGLLSSGARGGERKRARGVGREGGGQYAGRRGGTGAAFALGGDAGGIGTGQEPGNVGGRSALDLEFEAEPMEKSGGDAGLLSPKRTCVGVGPNAQRRERSQRLGGTIAASVTAWEREKSVEGNSRDQCAQRPEG